MQNQRARHHPADVLRTILNVLYKQKITKRHLLVCEETEEDHEKSDGDVKAGGLFTGTTWGC